MFDNGKAHRRYNPLTGDWVLVSPGRLNRPWLGAEEQGTQVPQPSYDPDCYLCPGNERAGGKKNPAYTGTYVFDNDFPALLPDGEGGEFNQEDLILARNEAGRCRVLCFTPQHDRTLSRMDIPEIHRVVDAWTEEYRLHGADESINYVTIFENRGEMMGASNPHPHCQIWANETVPPIPGKKTWYQMEYLQYHGSNLLLDYCELERKAGERILFENRHFICLVPYWAIWPFETMILPKEHLRHLGELSQAQARSLSEALKRTTVMYDNLFRVPFPYSMGIHQAPTDRLEHPEWQMHISFYPPLLRSSTIRKFMVGYELFAMAQRDVTPEEAARRLRDLPEKHYTEG
ncbi:MAG: UDP-glucose--hexose-1-phosphate uridylyltransferase [Spirochaetales bacterium]|nr:UDP-glucose--hexose-1-phosphate uridylyltransferase [Spirochaetales bacterium]